MRREQHGAVYCWGDNQSGELGNGTNVSSSTPVAVVGLSGPAVALTAGLQDTCALIQGGAVECWGYNPYGELGNGTSASSNVPVAVGGLSDVVAIAAGQYHVCALLGGGAVVCWGYNADGELGDGTRTNSSTPTAVKQLLTGMTAISAGAWNTCTVSTTNGAQCWGDNTAGQLGNGATGGRSTLPVDVSGLSGALQIAAGFEDACAVTSAAQVSCWGDNHFGELGDGTAASTNTPALVSGLVASTDSSVCSATSGGSSGDAPLPIWAMGLLSAGLLLIASRRGAHRP